MNKLIFKMAWRNIWRSRQRTIISISSVFIAGLLCILLNSYSSGTINYVVDSVVSREIGTFQVMGIDYWDDKVVDNYIQITPTTLEAYEKVDNVKKIAPRITTFAMGWNGTKTRPLSLVAIDPKRESEFAGLNNRMISGKFLSQNDNGIIIGSECAKIMSLNVGDTLALVGQGYHGAGAAQLFPIRGIVECFDKLQDASTVYTSLSEGQYFLSMPNGISNVSILVEDEYLVNQTMADIEKVSNRSDIDLMLWEDLIGDTIVATMQEKKAMVIYLYFLYFIVFFGLLGTVIMLISERKKEFGVMAAVGTKRSNITTGICIELLVITFLGLFISFIVALPIVAYFHYNPMQLPGEMAKAFLEYGLEPILPFDFSLKLFGEQILVVFIMSLFVMIYPITTIGKMNIIDALRN